MEGKTESVPYAVTAHLQIQQKRTGDDPMLDFIPHSTDASADNVELKHPDHDISLTLANSSGGIFPAKFPSPPPEGQLETMDQIRARLRALSQAEVDSGQLIEALVANRRR